MKAEKKRTSNRGRKSFWESLCKRCGICCYEKEAGLFGTIIHLSQPCEYFDEKTKLCTVYEERFRACRWCGKVTVWHAVFSRCLPSTCGYVEHFKRWRLVRGAEIKR